MMPCVLIATSLRSDVTLTQKAGLVSAFGEYEKAPGGRSPGATPNLKIYPQDVTVPLVGGEEENGGGGGEAGKKKVGRVSELGISFSVFTSTPPGSPAVSDPNSEAYKAKYPPILRAEVCLKFDDVFYARSWLEHSLVGKLVNTSFNHVVIYPLSTLKDLGTTVGSTSVYIGSGT
jgi:hypothetical protein